MSRYLVVFEQGPDNWSAYCPDLPGCVSTGVDLAETRASMREALALHLDGLREEGLPIPAPSGVCAEMLETPAPTGATDPARAPVLKRA